MFTLGDVADILDGALDTGISIIDTLSKLSDIADEGTINRDKCFERLQIDQDTKSNRSDLNNNDNNNSNVSIDNIPDYTANTNLSATSDVNNNAGYQNEQVINSNVNNAAMETEMSILNVANDTERGNGVPLRNSNALGESESDKVNENKLEVVTRRSGSEKIKTKSKGNRRSTFVFKESPIKTVGDATAQGIPIIEALGDLCNVADDFLKDYGHSNDTDSSSTKATTSSLKKPDTPSTPEEFDFLINTKVSEILSSFKKLDTTVDLLKKKALRENFADLKGKDKELLPKEYQELLTDLEVDTQEKVVSSLNKDKEQQQRPLRESKDSIQDSLINTQENNLSLTNDLLPSPGAENRKEKRNENIFEKSQPTDSVTDNTLNDKLAILDKSENNERTEVYKTSEINGLNKTPKSGEQSPTKSPVAEEPTQTPVTELKQVNLRIDKPKRKVKSRPGTYTLSTVLDNVPLKEIEIDIENDMDSRISSPDCFFKPQQTDEMKVLNKNLLSSSKRLPELQVFPIDVDFEPLADESKNNVDMGFRLTRERPGTYVISSSSGSEESPKKPMLKSKRFANYTESSPHRQLYVNRNERSGTYTKKSSSDEDHFDRNNRPGTYVKESGSSSESNDQSFDRKNRTGTYTKKSSSDEDHFDRNNRPGTYVKESGSSCESNDQPFDRTSRTGTYTKKSSLDEGHFDRNNRPGTYVKESGSSCESNDQPFDRTNRTGTYTKKSSSDEDHFDRNNRPGTYVKESGSSFTTLNHKFDRNERSGTYTKKKIENSADKDLESEEPEEPNTTPYERVSKRASRPQTYVMESEASNEEQEILFDRNKMLGTNESASSHFDRKKRPGTYVLSSKNSTCSPEASSSESNKSAEHTPEKSTKTALSPSLHFREKRASTFTVNHSSVENSPVKTKVKEESFASLFREKRSHSFSEEVTPKSPEGGLNKSQSMSNIKSATEDLYETNITRDSRLAASQPNLLSTKETRKISIGNTTYSKLGLLKKAMSASLTKLTELHAVQREISLSTNTLTASGSDDDVDVDETTLTPDTSVVSVDSLSKNTPLFSAFEEGDAGYCKTLSHEETMLTVHDIEYDDVNDDAINDQVEEKPSIFCEYPNTRTNCDLIEDEPNDVTVKSNVAENETHVVLREKKGRASGSLSSTYVLSRSKDVSAESVDLQKDTSKEVLIYDDLVDDSCEVRSPSSGGNNPRTSPFRQTILDRNNKPFVFTKKSAIKIHTGKTPERQYDGSPKSTTGLFSTTKVFYASPNSSPNRWQKPSSGHESEANSPESTQKSSITPESSPTRTRKSSTGLYTSKTAPVYTNFLRRKSKGPDPKHRSSKKTGK